MVDTSNVDPRTLSAAEFAELLAPATGNGIGAMDPWAFTRLIKHASAEQLDAVLDSPTLRRALLERIFSRMAGEFRPEGAPDRDSAIHWRITGGPAGDEVYETWITGTRSSSTPRCSTSDEPSHDPRVTLTMSGRQFLRLVSGDSSPAMMLVMGKMKLDGDIGFAARLPTIFDMPNA
ncbi:MAG: SCP2 sterol-binding domain-containing protein [Pseudonocardiales bacterium]|nr:SCP2 sterol-binding domain-containing protein [Pseudonocardiales bacterium]MBW0010234.1 SCP2 sterol-binding domain-containing protein [Pseudonocardiales bacterium]